MDILQSNHKTENVPSYPREGRTNNDKVLIPQNERQQIGCGLVGYKNNCFFNAVIQVLFHSPTFLKCMEENKENHIDCVTCCVRDTYKEMKLINKTRIPWNLYNLLQRTPKIRFLINGKQQDAHDFLLMLLERMYKEHTTNLVTKSWQGNVTSTVTCSKCNIVSETTKVFTSLQLPISGDISINEALKNYFRAEQVTYNCDGCKLKVLADKKFTIATVPSILVLQLLRFSDSKTKTNNSIQIFNSIDISQYSGGKQQKEMPKMFKLVAMVNHKGTHLNQGHYTVTAKSNANSWHEFDDSRIFQITNADGNFNSNEAYILFYEVMDVKNANESTENVEETPLIGDTESTENLEETYSFINDTYTEVPHDSFGKATNKSEEYIPIPTEVIDTDSDVDGYIPIEIVDLDTNLGEYLDIIHNKSTEVPVLMNDENELESYTQSLWGESLESSKIEDEECDKLSGRRIVDIDYLFNQMQKMTTNKCKKCVSGNMLFEKEIKRGLMSIFTFRCNICEKAVRINSCAPKNLCQSNVNESAVLGIVSIGLGFYHLQEFLAHLDVNCMSYSTFHRLDGKLQAAWWKLAKQFEEEALNEEIRLAKADNQVDSAGNALIEAEIDGSWCKRSFGNNFSSLSGCAAIIGRRTNKIVYSGIKNKYCHICKIAESQDMTPRIHDCKANYVGASSGMETEIIIDGFKFCNEKGARFPLLVGDGDSSTYKAIRDLNLYKDPDMDTEKLLCENHVYKNFNKKCGSLHTNTKLNKGGRKLLPLDIGNNISKGVRMAAKHWREADIDLPETYVNLERDIMNAPLHYLGIHDGCAEYFCDKVTDPEALCLLGLLKESGIYYELLDYCQFYLSNNAKSLIAGLSTNHTEGFNSLICKTLGGKRVCNSLDGNSYKARTAIADVHFNTKGHSGSTFHEITYGGVKDSCLKLENARKRKVKRNEIYKENRAKKQKLEDKHIKGKKEKKEKNKSRRYGPGREDSDLVGSAFEVAKERTLAKLKENQNNQNALVKETMAQRNSFKWMQVRKGMLTSSYFSRILKANNRKSYTRIIEEILHNNIQYSNTAELRHQRWYQLEALEIFSQIYRFEPVSQCGIFIDTEFDFIV